jgi:hypothetical protein
MRRIQTASALISAEERKRLAEYMRNTNPSYLKVLEELERGA